MPAKRQIKAESDACVFQLLSVELLQQSRIPSLCYRTGDLKRLKYSGKWARRFAWKFEQKEKIIGHVASRETVLRTEQPDKDRGCSFYHALGGNGLLLIITKVSLAFTWLIKVLTQLYLC